MDAMILVAAMGIGLALARTYQSSLESAVLASAGAVTYPFRIRYFGRPAPLLTSLTLALFALRFFGPRPRYRRLVGAPGFAACYAVVLGLAITALTALGELTTNYLGYSQHLTYPHYLMMRSIRFAAPSVASVWVALALLGRWRRHPERDWIEVTGLILGFGWLALFAATQLNF